MHLELAAVEFIAGNIISMKSIYMKKRSPIEKRSGPLRVCLRRECNCTEAARASVGTQRDVGAQNCTAR